MRNSRYLQDQFDLKFCSILPTSPGSTNAPEIMSHSIVFEEADDLQKLAADVENVLSSARVGASLPINTTSQTS